MTWLLCAALSAGLQAASFDCKLAISPVEKAICASKELSAADDAMDAEYKSVLAAVPRDVQAEVRNDQRSWLRQTTESCNRQPQGMIAECVKGTYASQMDVLKKRVTTVNGVRFVVRSVELKSKDASDDPWKDRDRVSLEKNAGYGTLTANWPQALSATPEWKAWNAAVLRATIQMAGADDKSGYKWSDSMANGTETEITATVGHVGTQLVSVSLSADNMGHGAAHPSEGYESVHWMLKEQRALKVSDVFQAGSGWEKVVSAACRASLRTQVGADYASYAADDFAKTLSKIIRDPANWTFDGKGLVISFPEYSVTPRMEPVDPVMVLWSTLEAYISRGFVIPR